MHSLFDVRRPSPKRTLARAGFDADDLDDLLLQGIGSANNGQQQQQRKRHNSAGSIPDLSTYALSGALTDGVTSFHASSPFTLDTRRGPVRSRDDGDGTAGAALTMTLSVSVCLSW